MNEFLARSCQQSTRYIPLQSSPLAGTKSKKFLGGPFLTLSNMTPFLPATHGIVGDCPAQACCSVQDFPQWLPLAKYDEMAGIGRDVFFGSSYVPSN